MVVYAYLEDFILSVKLMGGEEYQNFLFWAYILYVELFLWIVKAKNHEEKQWTKQLNL